MVGERHDFRIVLHVDESRTTLCYRFPRQFLGVGRLLVCMLRYHRRVVWLRHLVLRIRAEPLDTPHVMVRQQIAVSSSHDIRLADSTYGLHLLQVVAPCTALREHLAHLPCTRGYGFQLVLDTAQHDLLQLCQLLVAEVTSLHTFNLLPAESLSLLLTTKRYLRNDQQPHGTSFVEREVLAEGEHHLMRRTQRVKHTRRVVVRQ